MTSNNANKSVNAVMKRYMIEFIGAMAAYVVVLLLSLDFLPGLENSPWRIPVALAPVIPIFFALTAFLRYLNNVDELQQRIQLNAIGFAAGATGLVALTVGFLENAGLPRPSWIWVFPMMILFWGLGGYLANRRYR